MPLKNQTIGWKVCVTRLSITSFTNLFKFFWNFDVAVKSCLIVAFFLMHKPCDTGTSNWTSDVVILRKVRTLAIISSNDCFLPVVVVFPISCQPQNWMHTQWFHDFFWWKWRWAGWPISITRPEPDKTKTKKNETRPEPDKVTKVKTRLNPTKPKQSLRFPAGYELIESFGWPAHL